MGGMAGKSTIILFVVKQPSALPCQDYRPLACLAPRLYAANLTTTLVSAPSEQCSSRCKQCSNHSVACNGHCDSRRHSWESTHLGIGETVQFQGCAPSRTSVQFANSVTRASSATTDDAPEGSACSLLAGRIKLPTYHTCVANCSFLPHHCCSSPHVLCSLLRFVDFILTRRVLRLMFIICRFILS